MKRSSPHCGDRLALRLREVGGVLRSIFTIQGLVWGIWALKILELVLESPPNNLQGPTFSTHDTCCSSLKQIVAEFFRFCSSNLSRFPSFHTCVEIQKLQGPFQVFVLASRWAKLRNRPKILPFGALLFCRPQVLQSAQRWVHKRSSGGKCARPAQQSTPH